ncbi:MAG: capsular biosynthesis protein [Pseudomonadota bacterium]
MSDRTFLFLQSHPSFYGKTLVKEMRSNGAKCHIINLSIGDWFFRFGTGAKNYFGKIRDWRSYLRNFIKKHAITDIVYYADQKPYHRIARSLAYELGIATYAYEFGYLRPDWITIEKGGMGAFSHFPNDPRLIKKLAANVEYDQPQEHYPYPFLTEATCEVVYHMGNSLFFFLFHHYRADRYYHPWIDFPSYIPRLLRTKKMEAHAQDMIEKLAKENTEFFVVPMQIQSDYQIRRASHYEHMSEMVDEVMRSFKVHAPEKAQLVFKVHPLDNNIERWPRVIDEIASNYDLSDRVIVIDGGDLNKLIQYTKGVILINSTTGILVLELGIPLKVLGIAIFDVPGLAHQGPLDDFWINPPEPDAELTSAFLKLLTASVQIKGNFFTKKGKTAAAKEMSRRLLEDDVNTNGAFVSPPPRLEQAKRRRVPMIYEDLEY